MSSAVTAKGLSLQKHQTQAPPQAQEVDTAMKKGGLGLMNLSKTSAAKTMSKVLHKSFHVVTTEADLAKIAEQERRDAEEKRNREHAEAKRFSDEPLLFGIEEKIGYHGHVGQPLISMMENPTNQ